MNRQQLAVVVGHRLGDAERAETAIAAVIDVIMATVAAGEPVAIGDFGRWSRRQRPARGVVPATYVPRFDPGPALRDAVAAAELATRRR